MKHSRSLRLLAVAGPAVLLATALSPCTRAAAQAAPPPRLVVLLIVDQCRPDYFERFAPHCDGFFARLAAAGRWFTEGEQHHALTVTAPGHATLGTGRFPANHGIVGNEFFVPELRRLVAAVEDQDAAPLAGGGGGGASARWLRCDGLGDWWQRAHPGAKVVGISLKPRSAILPLGQGPHSAWWFDDARGAFVSSARCAGTLPPWAAAEAARNPIEALPTSWERRLADDDYAALGCTDDDEEGEAPTGRPPSRTFPHGLAATSPASRSAALAVSPYGDSLVLDFARAAVAGEALGADAVPDLLVLGLSATDLIGHRHGPDSWELAEQFVALDRALLEFGNFLAARVDPEQLLYALSSDHGIPALPEVAHARGAAGDRVDWTMLQPGIDAALAAIDSRLAGAAIPLPEFGIRLDRARLAAAERDVADVARALAAALRRDAAYRDARSHAELQEPLAEEDRLGELLRAASDGERAGDLLFVLPPGTIYMPAPNRVAALKGTLATSHGSPWDDDRRVPIVFLGAGVTPGRVSGRAWTVDVAPTLARAVGIVPPTGLDGVPLPLR